MELFGPCQSSVWCVSQPAFVARSSLMSICCVRTLRQPDPFDTCRQKRSMGLTVAEAELARLDHERVRDRVTLERERSYAENIIAKIEDVL